MKGSYDSVALFYDQLAGLVFGKTLQKAQAVLLHAVPPQSRVLIAGGGTGLILEELTKVHPTGLKITYIDSSAAMIAKAKRRDVANNRIRFLTEPLQTVPLKEGYDVIITPFFFDNFSNRTARQIFERLHRNLKDTGLWLYSDFQLTGDNSFRQRATLKFMYTFFRLSCGIEADTLPDMDSCFAEYGYKPALEKTYKNQFVVSRVYQHANAVA